MLGKDLSFRLAKKFKGRAFNPGPRGELVGKFKLKLMAKAIFGIFFILPLMLMFIYKILPPPITTMMIVRSLSGMTIKHSWIDIKHVSPHVAPAVMAAEDNRFCEHWGVDWLSLRGEVSDALRGENTRGASTIQMQTVKNLMLWPGRSYVRKGLEIYLAPMLNLVWSKSRIMEVYLNIAEWGPNGVFGIEAAAQYHFKKSATRLSRYESAQLAAVLPNPQIMIAGRPSVYVKEQAAIIDHRVDQSGGLLDCAQ